MKDCCYIKNTSNVYGTSKLLDSIFVLGIVLAPMQDLRIFKFGPGEILLIVWMIAVFIGNNPSTKYGRYTLPITEIGSYQVANLAMMIVGLMVNAIVYRADVQIGGLAVDYFSHLFMFLVSCCMVLYFEERPIDDINKIIKKVVVIGAVVYGLLLVYATYINYSIFGIPLWMSNKTRFLGLGSNPHQIGMITGTGVFFSLYVMSLETRSLKKVFYIFVAGVWFWVSLSLKSDTMTVSYVIAAGLFVILKVLKKTDNSDAGHGNSIIVMMVFLILLVAFLPRLINSLFGFVEEAGNGLGRIEIWNAGLSQFKEKIICFFTGLGPGANTGMYMKYSGNEMEAHNTYVQQILNSGIFVCIYYISLVYKLVRNPINKNTYLVMSIIYFFLYGFGGNMNRRILVWFTFTMVWLLNQKTEGMEIGKI